MCLLAPPVGFPKGGAGNYPRWALSSLQRKPMPLFALQRILGPLSVHQACMCRDKRENLVCSPSIGHTLPNTWLNNTSHSGRKLNSPDVNHLASNPPCPSLPCLSTNFDVLVEVPIELSPQLLQLTIATQPFGHHLAAFQRALEIVRHGYCIHFASLPPPLQPSLSLLTRDYNKR